VRVLPVTAATAPGYPVQNEVFDGLPITRVALTQRGFRADR
jgi:SAM-dependent MidA family methyltransferase